MHNFHEPFSNPDGHPGVPVGPCRHDPWYAAASSPSGERFLLAGFRGTSNTRSAFSVDAEFDSFCESFGMFADRLALLRHRLCHALAQAEALMGRQDMPEEVVRILVAAIGFMASDFKNARRSRYGWQDIHADDVRISVCAKAYCARLSRQIRSR